MCLWSSVLFILDSVFHALSLFQFIPPISFHPVFCHIYAFGLDASCTLVLTQEKNYAACSLPHAFCVPQLLSNLVCSSPMFVCLHICLNICRVKAYLPCLVRLFFFFFLPLMVARYFLRYCTCVNQPGVEWLFRSRFWRKQISPTILVAPPWLEQIRLLYN